MLLTNTQRLEAVTTTSKTLVFAASARTPEVLVRA
jgi:hypothetical protein